MRRTILRLLGGTALQFAITAAIALPLPHAIRIYTGTPPGGTNDVLARLVAEHLTRELKTTVIVENLPGAGGAIAQAKVLNGPADGTSILLASSNDVLVDAIAGTQKMAQQLLPLGGIATLPFVVVGRAGLPVSFDELLQEAKRSPGQPLKVGGAGSGTYAQLVAEAVQRDAAVAMTYVPYKGSAQVLTDVMGGHLDLAIAGLAAVVPHLKTRSIRVYGVFAPKRSPLAPDVPALVESQVLRGMHPFAEAWVGLMVPARTGADVRQSLAGALAKVVAAEDLRQQITKAGATVAELRADELLQIVRSDTVSFAALIKQANIKPQQ